jgi:hypothetical protein
LYCIKFYINKKYYVGKKANRGGTIFSRGNTTKAAKMAAKVILRETIILCERRRRRRGKGD